MASTPVQRFCGDALGEDDATGLAERVRDGDVTPLELTEAAIQRIDAVDPVLNALSHRSFASARRQAANKDIPGYFRGVPAVAKENINIRGMPMTYGSAAVPTHLRRMNGGFTKQILQSGLILLGTTTMPAFGWTATTERVGSFHTANPWRPGFSSGGSSGGSAALVASGAVPIAHGNDGGGSIRIPASFCGLVALKPTRGMVRTDPSTRMLPIDIMSNGVLARSVRDVRNFFVAAEASFRRRSLPSLRARQGPLPKLRIGVVLDSPLSPDTDNEIRRVVEDVGRILAVRGHGVTTHQLIVSPAITHDFADYWSLLAFTITRAGKVMYGRKFDRSRLDPLTVGLTSRGQANIARAPQILHRLRSHRADYLRNFEDIDVILSPVVAQHTPRIGYLSPELPFEEHVERLEALAPFTPVHNVVGAPAITLPGGLSSQGLPIGVMMAGTWGTDGGLLQLASEIEETLPFPRIQDVG